MFGEDFEILNEAYGSGLCVNWANNLLKMMISDKKDNLIKRIKTT